MQLKLNIKQVRMLGVAVIGTALAAATTARAAYSENFENVTAGTTLNNVSGWSATGSGIIQTGGYNGGNRMAITGAYTRPIRTLSGDEIHSWDEGVAEFRAKIYFTADTLYTEAFIGLLKTSGGNGLNVMFKPGSALGSDDNYIQVSSGGDAQNSVQYTTVLDGSGNVVRWEIGHWYEVVIKDIALRNTGIGNDVTSLLDIYKDGSLLVGNIAVKGVGGTSGGSFSSINYISVGGYRVAYDDVSLMTVPEPAAAGLLGAGIGAMMLRKKNEKMERPRNV